MARKYADIDAYVVTRDPRVVPLLEDLRAFVHATLPDAKEDVQFGVPAFLNAHGVPVIYLYGSKKHVNFGFLRSADLSDPDGVLQGTGTPSKHIRLPLGQPVDKVMLGRFVDQCADIKG